MDAASSSHPTDQTLSSYGLGKLGEGPADEVRKHLEECADCLKRVSEISSDSFLDRVRDAQPGLGQGTSGQSQTGGTQAYLGTNSVAPPPTDTLPPGLADHPDYEIKRELGRGGMGVVYLAHNALMGRDEVLKVMGRQIIERPGVLDRFLREIRAVAKLRHPNIVKAYSAFRLGESIVFAMEYVDGFDLSKLVKSKGQLPVGHACNLIYQAALGLQHAHEEGLVHRDIKPGNLMLSRKGEKGTVKVLDFGLAKVTREEKVDVGLTSIGQALGTPDFIAPEQILDAQSADIRADIYSLGGTLYYLLSGRPPFQASSLYDMYQAHISRDAEMLNFVRPEVPSELGALVAKMMAKDPKRRFQTPGEAAQALTPFFKRANVAFTRPHVDVSRAARIDVSQPVTGRVPTPTQPATDSEGPAAQPRKPAEPAVPETEWGSLINLAETERSKEKPKPAPKTSAAMSKRPPWMTWPFIAMAFLFGFIALGVIVTITIENGRTKVTVEETGNRKGEPSLGASRPMTVDPVESKKAPEANPWPAALPLAGQRFPQGSRFLAMSRDCQRVAVTLSTGELRIIEAPDASTGVDIKGRPRYENGGLPFAWGHDFSPDGKHLAVGFNNYPVKIWNAPTGEEVRQLGVFGYAVAYSSDGKRLARAGGLTKVVTVLDAATSENVVALGPHSVITRLVAFSPDGKRLASGGGPTPGDKYDEKGGLGGELKLWDLETGTGTVLEGHPLRVTDLAFSSDGKRLAGASIDKTVKVWDLASKQCVITFDKHRANVLSVRFSPDGRLIASAGAENAVRIWDSATGREVTSVGLPGHPDFVQFSPVGSWVYSGGGDVLRAWETVGLMTQGSSVISNPPRATPVEPQPPPASSSSTVGGEAENTAVRKPQAAPATDLNPGFVSHFNGKDLTGWKPHARQPLNWRVQNGVLVGSGLENSILYSERDDYKDFHLRLEVRINDSGNSGVYFRVPFGAGWGKDFEAQIGDNVGALHVNGKPAPRVPHSRIAADRWFTFEVVAEGSRVVTMVDGKVVTEFLDASHPSSRGHIALELAPHPSSLTLVEFRKIEIKELNGTQGSTSTNSAAVIVNQASVPKSTIPSTAKKAGARRDRIGHPTDAKAFSGNYYKVFNEHLSWHQARDKCKEMGGHLAIIRNAEENRFVTSLVQAAELKYAWLGASDERVEGQWVWVDSTEMRYNAWDVGAGQPNNNGGGIPEHYLIVVAASGLWFDLWAEGGNGWTPGFVCQWDGKK